MEHKHWDVLVAGGGVSGCMAALAAARCGAKTLIVERCGYLGGSLTNAGVGPMMTFHAGERRVIGGLPQELVTRLVKCSASTGHIEDTTGYASSVTPFDSESLKVVLDEMMAESGIDVLFHTYLAEALCCDSRITGVRAASQSGMITLNAEVYVDATGDGLLSFLSGAEIQKGRKEDGFCQPMTTNIKLDHVDTTSLKEEIKSHPGNFNIRDLEALERSPRLSVAGFYKEFEQAKHLGELSTSREDVLLFETANENEVILNTTRVICLDATDPWQLSRAEAMGRAQAREVYNFLKNNCRGFENAVFLSTGSQIGIRESRRVVGHYMLTDADLLSSKHFEDTVALGSYPIDIHNPTGESTLTKTLEKGQYYYIPLRCLTVRGVKNLFTSGRCISATHEACAAIRVSPIAMALGQAAGIAAAICFSDHTENCSVDYKKIKDTLKQSDAILE